MSSRDGATVLHEELDEAIAALTAFDAARFETIERRIHTVTAEGLAGTRELLPEIVAKHALLGQLLTATAANLKVLVSVLNLESRMEPR